MPPGSPTYGTQVMTLWSLKCALVAGGLLGPGIAFYFFESPIHRGLIIVSALLIGLFIDSRLYKRSQFK